MGVPQCGQKLRVKSAPESAGRSKLETGPVMVTSDGAASATVAWPVPVAFWQSRQEHMSIAKIGPCTRTATAPHAQRAERSTDGFGALDMPEAGTGQANLQLRPARLTTERLPPIRILPMVYAPDYPILTHRLRLRPFTRGDVEAVFAYRQREDVARFLFDSPMSHETVTEAIQQRISQSAVEQEGDKLVLAVDLRETGELVGEISLIWRSEIARQGELGYIFNPLFHGHGYATEASEALLRIGFEDLGLHRIMARCDARNRASWRVMERLGMRREAHFREHARFKGEWDEEFVYAILEDEWAARRVPAIAVGEST